MYGIVSGSITGSIDNLARIVQGEKDKRSPTMMSLPSTGEKLAVSINEKEFVTTPNPNAPVVISWKDVVVTTKLSGTGEEMVLINNISGSITGGLWAIMGPSGSGKVRLRAFYA